MLHKASMIGGLRLQKASNSSTSNGYDIEAEAKSYFQQLFSGQMTTDAMVQMLSRFKDSSERRLIFNSSESFKASLNVFLFYIALFHSYILLAHVLMCNVDYLKPFH